MAPRKVEVFVAGCPLCESTVRLVQSLACPSCQVTVYDLSKGHMDVARQYGVVSVPTVVVNGKIAACCDRAAPNEADLRAAGVGVPLT